MNVSNDWLAVTQHNLCTDRAFDYKVERAAFNYTASLVEWWRCGDESSYTTITDPLTPTNITYLSSFGSGGSVLNGNSSYSSLITLDAPTFSYGFSRR
jgi:hypothetical protein